MYKRVLLKLSGEAFLGKSSSGVDEKALAGIVNEIKKVKKLKVELAIVVGGGNIWRGGQQKIKIINRVTLDYMGMLATIMNSLALRDALENVGIETHIQSAIEVGKITEPLNINSAVQHLRKGRIIIFAGGTGNPYFTTDTTAVLRAIEISADVLLKGTQVDGVYTEDPHKNLRAKKFSHLTFMSAIKKHLKIMDTTAFSLCLDSDLVIIVFNLYKSGNILNAIKGKKIGTLVTK
ncbi:MAG: UMP kinase [Elusimicrobia bacterium CG1_02_37_114]|nr:MAG: UMP kinase [Elusimicrobia bacterium CG1_02_37_114]PIZ14020.1 MAG: UMP kinase [Elusimicrobia bacterium CG_4_10_14_0_8_um_filter_37_32]